MPRRNNKGYRILLVEDQLLVREGIRVLLDGLPETKVVGEASGCAEAMSLTLQERPDLIIINLQLAEGQALAILTEIGQSTPSNPGLAANSVATVTSKVIVLTSTIEVEECRRAIVLGAKGVVLKTRPASSLFTAIERVSKGEVWIDPEVMTQILSSATSESEQNRNPEKENIASLTEREIEVIELLAEGLTNNEIAERMFVSEGTVRHYLNRVFTKLHITDRSKLLIYAFRHGIAKPF